MLKPETISVEEFVRSPSLVVLYWAIPSNPPTNVSLKTESNWKPESGMNGTYIVVGFIIILR
jgi:hypothetical protein